MTDIQKAARKKSAESGPIKWIKDHCLCTRESGEDYVFISYKSDEYDQVLDGIIYRTCQKYGLRVYFDVAFDDGSDSWIKQFYKNMCSVHCKGMIAFLSNKYYSSYATLLEMMARKTHEAGGDYEFDTLFFLPINLESILDMPSEENTGLGTERFQDGKINRQASEELRLFNEIFQELAADDNTLNFMYKHSNETSLYREATEDLPRQGEPYLTVALCRKLMDRICPKSNDNDGTNKDFTEVIRDKLVNAGLSSVFIPNWEPADTSAPSPVQNLEEVPELEPAPEIWPEPKTALESIPELSLQTTLGQFAELCEFPDFCRLLRDIRESQRKQPFDYLMAALLRGCDQKLEKNSAGWNYCTFVVSRNVDLEDPKMGASQFTWTTACRKAVNLEGSSKLGERSQSLSELPEDLTLEELRGRFAAASDPEDLFWTKNNTVVLKALDAILADPKIRAFSRDNWPV